MSRKKTSRGSKDAQGKQMNKTTQKNPAAGKPATGGKGIILIPVKIKKHRDKNGGHNHIILETFENKHVSVGLTTREKKGENSTNKNYRCEVDPLGQGKESYMRRQGTVAKIKEYAPKEKTGKVTTRDYEKARSYGERAKQKYLEKQKNKKK